MVQPGEIYWVEGVDLGKCKDARPCLVLYVSGKVARVCRLSAQLDLAEGGEVTLLKSDPDFAASGLKRSSYIPRFAEYEFPWQCLNARSAWAPRKAASRRGSETISESLFEFLESGLRPSGQSDREAAKSRAQRIDAAIIPAIHEQPLGGIRDDHKSNRPSQRPDPRRRPV